MTADPILALKYFGLCLAIALVFWILSKVATGFRVAFGKTPFVPSTIEVILMLIALFFAVISPICLVWSFVAWIAS